MARERLAGGGRPRRADPDGRVAALRGPTSEPVPLADAAWPTPVTSEVAPGTVWLVRGGHTLPLWPLCLYGEPRPPAGEPSGLGEAPQVYSRRGEVRLEYTPLGSRAPARRWATRQGSPRSSGCFSSNDSSTSRRSRVSRFGASSASSARTRTGSWAASTEVETLAAALAAAPDGVLWVSGPAGIGKSFVVARVVADLLEAQPPHPVTAPRRTTAFAGDRRRGARGRGGGRAAADPALPVPCGRRPLQPRRVTAVRHRTPAGWDGRRRAPEEDDGEAQERLTLIDRFKARLRTVAQHRRVIVVLDGLDEVAERDATFAAQVPLALAVPGVTWLCVGRPERGLPEAFQHAGAREPFPGGLPPMRDGDVRTMLLEKVGPLRTRLLKGDRDAGEAVVNPFITRVAENAHGLPIYVTYVVGDVLAGKIAPDVVGAAALPPSLAAYHERLLERCEVGDLRQVLPPLVGTLAVAREPLTGRRWPTCWRGAQSCGRGRRRGAGAPGAGGHRHAGAPAAHAGGRGRVHAVPSLLPRARPRQSAHDDGRCHGSAGAGRGRVGAGRAAGGGRGDICFDTGWAISSRRAGPRTRGRCSPTSPTSWPGSRRCSPAGPTALGEDWQTPRRDGAPARPGRTALGGVRPRARAPPSPRHARVARLQDPPPTGRRACRRQPGHPPGGGVGCHGARRVAVAAQPAARVAHAAPDPCIGVLEGHTGRSTVRRSSPTVASCRGLGIAHCGYGLRRRAAGHPRGAHRVGHGREDPGGRPDPVLVFGSDAAAVGRGRRAAGHPHRAHPWVEGATVLADGHILSWSRDRTLRLWTAEARRWPLSRGTQTPSGARWNWPTAGSCRVQATTRCGCGPRTVRRWPLSRGTQTPSGRGGTGGWPDPVVVTGPHSAPVGRRRGAPSHPHRAHGCGLGCDGAGRRPDPVVFRRPHLAAVGGRRRAPRHAQGAHAQCSGSDGPRGWPDPPLAWSRDHTLRVWAGDGAPFATLTGHTGWVRARGRWPMAGSVLVLRSDAAAVGRRWRPAGHSHRAHRHRPWRDGTGGWPDLSGRTTTRCACGTRMARRWPPWRGTPRGSRGVTVHANGPNPVVLPRWHAPAGRATGHRSPR